jgi:hypothetical protein
MHNTLRTRSARTVFSERESHDVTTTETHFPAFGWHDPSVRACWCVPASMETFFEINSFDQDREAHGGDSSR